MMVYCGNVSCKYNGGGNKCTAKKISLTFEGLHTKHQGFREVLSCKSYEECETSRQISGMMKNMDLQKP